MPFKEVTLTEEEKAALGSSFFKFDAIGTKLVGKFVKTTPQTGQFARAGAVDYVFKTKNAEGQVVDVTVNAPTDLAQKLKKALALPATDPLKLVPNKAVMITYASDLDVGKESPMKIFKLLVDDAPPKAATPPPPPPPAAEDDIDF